MGSRNQLKQISEVTNWDDVCAWAESNMPEVRRHMDTWGSHCGAPRSVYLGHIVRLLIDSARGDWLPIEIAPKGVAVPILAAWSDIWEKCPHAAFCEWDGATGRWYYAADGSRTETQPTHWMPVFRPQPK